MITNKIDNLYRVSELIDSGKLETQKFIEEIYQALEPMNDISGFRTSLESDLGRRRFVKSTYSRERKIRSKGNIHRTGEFVNGKLHDDRRLNVTIPQEILYTNKGNVLASLFNSFELSLGNLKNLNLTLDSEATEVLDRANLVLRQEDGTTLEIQVLSSEAKKAKDKDDPIYDEAQKTCNKLIDLMPIKPYELKPKHFYSVFQINSEIPSQDVLNQLEIKSSPIALHYIQKLRMLYAKSSENFRNINKPGEKYVKKLKRIVKDVFDQEDGTQNENLISNYRQSVLSS
jgi:hypothetical protein